MTRALIEWPSPNFDERDVAVKLQYIVLHYTGMRSAQDALQRLCDPAAKVSAHYMIDEDGRIYQLVDESLRAWHAGKSFWRGVTDLNSASIGIELVNPGHAHGYRAFPEAQIEALKRLLHAIIERHDLDAKLGLLAHSDIAPARKDDPGELFPWEELAKEGLGFWPVPGMDYEEPTDEAAQKFLKSIGYECGDDVSYRLALRAFRRRFVPHHLADVLDREVFLCIKAVARWYSDRA